MLAQLKSATFEECIDSEFEVIDDPAAGFNLKLTNVLEHAATPQTEAFSLFFLGPVERFMPQGIHKLKHNKLGELDIFLVPIGQAKDGFQYEAVFNHTIR